MTSAETFAALVVPERWAIEAARKICDSQMAVMNALGIQSAGMKEHYNTIVAVAKVIQYYHDESFPPDRN